MNENFFDVDERSWWAPVRYLPGCGIINELQPSDIVLRSPTSSERLVLLEEIKWLDDDVVIWLAITAGGRQQRVILYGSKVRRAR